MADTDPQGHGSLMEELRDTFLASGSTSEEFDSLVQRRHLPYWCTSWMVHSDPQHPKRIQDCFDQFLPPYSLIEIEVRNDDDDPTGKALLGIVERKVAGGHFSAAVNMLASTDAGFLDWGNLHFVDLKDFEIHFCKKASGKCSSKPRSKAVGWYHVSALRIVTMEMACNTGWMADAAISNFSDQLQDYMAAGKGSGGNLPEARDSGPPRRGDAVEELDLGEAPGERSDDEERRARTERKRESLHPVFAGAAGRAARDREAKEKQKEEQGLAERRRQDAARLARESAADANRALTHRGPQLVDAPRARLVAREDDPRDAGGGQGYGGRPGRSFLDDIGTIGSDDPYGSGGDHGRRGQDRGHPSGGGGGRDGDEKDRDDPGKKKKKRKSSSPSKKKEKVRGSAVIAPQKNKEKKRRRGHGDPGGDPSSSSDGRGRGHKKQGRKDSRSPRREAKRKRSKDEDKKRKRSGRTHKRGRRSSSSSKTSNSQDDLYGHETSKYESLVEKAKRHPGRLLRSGLEQMAKFLAARAGSEGEPEGSWRQQKVSAYLNQVLFNQHPPASIGMRNARELVTLAEGLDLLMEEDFARLGDLLMQRMKAVEASLSEGWGVANYQELIPPPKATLTTDQERAFATRHAIQQKRLQDSMAKKRVG